MAVTYSVSKKVQSQDAGVCDSCGDELGGGESFVVVMVSHTGIALCGLCAGGMADRINEAAGRL
jgi:hypothetical protein